MAAQPKKAHDDDEEITDVAGRKHDSKGRFLPEDGDDHDDHKNGQADRAKAGNGKAAGGKAGAPTPAAQKRVINRAVRVLNEIESRIHELREELEEQYGADAKGGPARGRKKDDKEDDEDDKDDEQPNGQGRVKHPEPDRRLKQNKDD